MFFGFRPFWVKNSTVYFKGLQIVRKFNVQLLKIFNKQHYLKTLDSSRFSSSQRKTAPVFSLSSSNQVNVVNQSV